MEKKRAQLFVCEICDYKTSRLFNLNRHFLTPKHKMIKNDNTNEKKRVNQNDTEVEKKNSALHENKQTKKTSKKRAKTSKNE